MKFTWTRRMSFAALFITIFSLLAGSAGHGTAIPLFLFFPVIFAFQSLVDINEGVILWLILIFQYPLFGLFLDFGKRVGKFRWFVAIGITIHIANLALAYFTYDIHNLL